LNSGAGRVLLVISRAQRNREMRKTMSYQKIKVPAGDTISMGSGGLLNVPSNPVIPFIEGDGIGMDITRAAMFVWDAAVKAAYGKKRRVAWMEVYAGEKANNVYGPGTWMPEETLDAIRKYLV
jgi:isocitrate dehydrogenase